MTDIAKNVQRILAQIAAASENSGAQMGATPRLVAVSKHMPASAVRTCYEAGQRAFGENYVQEAIEKQASLRDLAIEWHLIGPLQSNKCAQVAAHFDWIQSLDRAKLVPLLARARSSSRPPLNVLIQVNIDDESTKSGCAPSEVLALADLVVAEATLCLRGLMVIGRPDAAQATFVAMAALYAKLRRHFFGKSSSNVVLDTLSMGMSGDFSLAIAHGANLVRVGSAIFGAR
jgi:pyridoxal phosphate enzyme (YggS family)